MGKRRTSRPLPSRPRDSIHGAHPDEEVDLHGMRKEAALARVGHLLDRWEKRGDGGVFRIITGKGNRSEGEAVLLHAVGDRLREELGERVSEMARDAGGGGWLVRVAGKG